METWFRAMEPITEPSMLDGEVTAMGSPGIAQLHHLRALAAVLDPARAHYTATAVEQLRSLPSPVRRQVFARVLAEHPGLAEDPAIQQLADELGIPRPAMTGTATTAAVVRMEALLPALAAGLAVLERSRAEIAAELGARGPSERLPQTADDVLAWLLDERAPPELRAAQIGEALSGLAQHAVSLREAARQGARALVSETDPETLRARTRVAGWLPKTFRDAALAEALRAVHHHVERGRRYLEDVHETRFARAYAALVQRRTAR